MTNPFSMHSRFHNFACLVGIAGLVLLAAGAGAKDKAEYARDFRAQLSAKILPYWYDTAIDRERGGYVLADDGTQQARPATEKQLVTQARMIWGFSLAARKGFSDGRRDYLAAARHGYRFLLDRFLDQNNGGYFWTTDLRGQCLNSNKIVYGESFVIYAFVEYYRASGDPEPLRLARQLYLDLQRHAHDAKYGGWIEHFQSDWTPILKPTPEAIVEVAGYKSANTHLHLMEALTELYEATHDPAVRKSLEEAVVINTNYFYPSDPGRAAFHRHLDWSPVLDPASAGLSYGHNVEFAWLFVRADQVLGRREPWDYFNAYLRHALRYGYDYARGGLYSRGSDNQPATDTDKIWWVEAEMMAALTDALKHRANPEYSAALDQLLDFITRYQADPRDGIWFDTVTAAGSPKQPAKAHNWKANYHDVRAILKFVGAWE